MHQSLSVYSNPGEILQRLPDEQGHSRDGFWHPHHGNNQPLHLHQFLRQNSHAWFPAISTTRIKHAAE